MTNNYYKSILYTLTITFTCLTPQASLASNMCFEPFLLKSEYTVVKDAFSRLEQLESAIKNAISEAATTPPSSKERNLQVSRSIQALENLLDRYELILERALNEQPLTPFHFETLESSLTQIREDLWKPAAQNPKTRRSQKSPEERWQELVQNPSLIEANVVYSITTQNGTPLNFSFSQSVVKNAFNNSKPGVQEAAQLILSQIHLGLFGGTHSGPGLSKIYGSKNVVDIINHYNNSNTPLMRMAGYLADGTLHFVYWKSRNPSERHQSQAIIGAVLAQRP